MDLVFTWQGGRGDGDLEYGQVLSGRLACLSVPLAVAVGQAGPQCQLGQ